MSEGINNILNKVKESWSNLEKKKKIGMVAIILTISLLTIFVGYTQNKVDYASLFTNLELQDAGTIVNDLETKGIKYRLENNGKNILIDESLIDGYRIQLAMDGMMPQSSTGFEIFDNTGMMVTDEDRQIMYQRALTGELQRSIMSLDAVNSAKVHLVMPEKSIFDTETKMASASVIIDLKPAQNVNEQMIRGIAALISGAVDNMPVENIQVIDSKGNLLSGFLDSKESVSTLDVMGQYSEARKRFEREIEDNLNKLLGSAFGHDKIRVSVLADLDFDAQESTVISYFDPVVRSEQISASGGEIDIQQVTGGSIDDNISNVTDSVNGDNSTYSKTTNNELSTETKTTIKAPGKVNRLTTSILYDGTISDVNLVKIQNIVAAATGYDSERGDLISVEGIKFNNESLAETDNVNVGEVVEEGIFGIDNTYITWGLRGLGILTIIILTILTIKNSSKRKKEDKLFQEQLANGVSVSSKAPSFEDIELDIKPDTKGDKAQKYAKENPELAADLIKAWMKDQG